MARNGDVENDSRNQGGRTVTKMKEVWEFLTGHTARRLEEASRKIILDAKKSNGKTPGGETTIAKSNGSV